MEELGRLEEFVEGEDVPVDVTDCEDACFGWDGGWGYNVVLVVVVVVVVFVVVLGGV